MAVYFDKSYFPYNPSSDTAAYGTQFMHRQPDLPTDIADRYQVRVWREADQDRYGAFAQTRSFIGMLHNFVDRPDDTFSYYKQLSSQDKAYASKELSSREQRYVDSSRQTSQNPFGQFNADLAPSVYAYNYDDDPAYDPEYAPGQLLWSLVGRPGKSGRFLYQIKTQSLYAMHSTLSDSLVSDVLAGVTLDALNTDLLQTEAGCIALAKQLLNSDASALDSDQAAALIALLGMSNHLVLQGRRNLFGPSDTASEHDWQTGAYTAIQSFKSQDRHVFSHAFTADSDPLGTMFYDAPVYVGDTIYRSYIPGDTPVFKSDDGQMIQLTQTGWCVFEGDAHGDPVSIRDPERIARIFKARDSLRTVVSQLLDTAAQAQGLTPSAAYTHSQDLLARIQDASSTDVERAEAYQAYSAVAPLASVFRAIQLSAGETETDSGDDFAAFKALYTTETAAWSDDARGIQINQTRYYCDAGYFKPVSQLHDALETADDKFNQAAVLASRVASLRNERNRDSQALKAATWVRAYKAWKNDQDSLIV